MSDTVTVPVQLLHLTAKQIAHFNKEAVKLGFKSAEDMANNGKATGLFKVVEVD